MHLGKNIQSDNNGHVQQEYESIEPVPGTAYGRLVGIVRYVIFEHSGCFVAKSRI